MIRWERMNLLLSLLFFSALTKILNEVQLNARFNKSLDLKNSSLVGYFKKIKILFLSTLYAVIKLLTINGV